MDIPENPGAKEFDRLVRPSPKPDPEPGALPPAPDEDAAVTKAIDESFPGSDPPSFAGGRTTAPAQPAGAEPPDARPPG